MTGFLVQFMRAHFADPSNIEDVNFRDLIWQAGPDNQSDPASPILIESANRWDPRLVEMRPGIVIKSHAWRPVRAGIADKMWVDGRGFQVYGTIFNSSNTLFCVAGEALEVEKLATEVTRELVKFSEPIREQLNLIRFIVIERGECSILEESTQNFAVPVTIAYQMGEQWVIEPQVPRLRKVILQVQASLFGS